MKLGWFSRQVSVGLCTLGVASGCATRPDIETSTGTNAFHIAQAVRCEIRDALITIIADAVAENGDRPKADRLRRRDYKTEGADEEEAKRFDDLLNDAKRVAKRNANHRMKIDTLETTFARYADAAVAYEFELNLKQTNNVGASVDLLRTITRGSITAAPSASFEGTREATRNFRLVDNFQQLLANRPTIRVCNSLRSDLHTTRSPNAAYPIAGSLRLERLLREFLSFNQSANLVGPEDTQIPTMAETVEFITTLKAGIEPELKLTPLDRGLEITGGKLTLNSERHDRHKLVLTFTLPGRKETVVTERGRTERAALVELERQRDLQFDRDTQNVLRAIVDR